MTTTDNDPIGLLYSKSEIIEKVLSVGSTPEGEQQGKAYEEILAAGQPNATTKAKMLCAMLLVKVSLLFVCLLFEC